MSRTDTDDSPTPTPHGRLEKHLTIPQMPFWNTTHARHVRPSCPDDGWVHGPRQDVNKKTRPPPDIRRGPRALQTPLEVAVRHGRRGGRLLLRQIRDERLCG